jgi:hypothetical protein|tara:strand:+ start:8200 stop:8760 length:561 start_codon:yes stop_codon:yes gene_type:complete
MTTPDFGTSQLESMNKIVTARRTPQQELSLWQKATSMFQKSDLAIHKSLSTLKLQGFIPQDFVEQGKLWDKLPHSLDAKIDFGFKWEHMIMMNFQPHHFKTFKWRHYQHLSVGAKEMMQTCLDIHDLVALQLSPQQLHQLGWTWERLTAIGGDKDNISIPSNDINIYFAPKPETKTSLSNVSRFKF